MKPLLVLAVEAEGPTEVVNPILPTTSELFWAALTFFLLLALMKFVLLPPVMKVMHEREARLRSDRQAAESAAEEADEALSAYRSRIAEARSEADSIVGAARDRAEAYRKDQIDVANSEIAAIRASASADLAVARDSAMGRLQGDVATVAVAAASKVVRRELDVSAELDRVNAFVENARGGGK